MKNGIFKLDWASIGDAILMAMVSAVVVGLVQLVSTTGFNLFTADWASIGSNMLNMAFMSGVVVLGQNFISTDKGSILAVGAEN